MKIILIFLLLITFVGCSSSKKEGEVGFSDEIEKEFEGIENSDFVDPPPVVYQESTDSFPEEIEKKDSLIKESVARLPEPKLEDVADLDDPLSKIVAHCYLQEFGKAQKLFDSVYKKYKKNPSYWNQVGTCALLEGKYKKAQLYYNKSRDLRKNYVPPINNLGVLYQIRGEDQKALSAYEKATSLKGFSSTPYFNLAQLYLEYGLFKKARSIFNGLLKSKSGDADLLNGVAVSYLLEGNVSAAISFYDQIDSDFLSRPHINLNFALALHMAGKKEDAKDLLGRVNRGQLGQLKDFYRSLERLVGGN